MLQPLDPRILSALVRDDDDADSIFIPQAKRRLNEDRNLSLGVQLSLELYGRFKAQLYQDKAPNDDNRKGAERWHIRFRVRMQCRYTASFSNHHLYRALPLVTSASVPRPLKVLSIFMCSISLFFQSGSLIALRIGNPCSNGCGNMVTSAKSLDPYPSSTLEE